MFPGFCAFGTGVLDLMYSASPFPPILWKYPTDLARSIQPCQVLRPYLALAHGVALRHPPHPRSLSCMLSSRLCAVHLLQLVREWRLLIFRTLSS
ncbi:unnamed protein product, partial [Amoebophrya sp. A120]|eukprot:GSA120T00000216001.1